MKKAISLIITFSCYLSVICQSFITRNESLVQPILINPAVCGADFAPKATLSYEKQWLAILHAPSSFFASGEIRLGKFDFYNPRMFINDTRFRSLERVGLGAGVYSDNNGPFHEVNFLLTYSYHLYLNITGKINHYGTDISDIKPIDPDDPLIRFENYTNVNTSVGTYIYHNEYFVGFSGVNLINTAAMPMNFTLSNRVFYGLGGYRFRNENGSVILEPSVVLKYDLTERSTLMDIHAKMYLTKYGWLCFSYLNNAQFKVILALRVYKYYYLAYKFAWIQNGLSTYTYNTHGIMLGINLGVNRNTTNIY